MHITRRTFLTGAASLPMLAALPRPSLAEIRIGEATLTTVSDGHLVLPADFIFGPMPQDQLDPVLRDLGVDPAGPLKPECNLTLYRDGSNTVLFDAGSGPDFMPTAGKILDGLEAVGLTPEDITHVVFTHAHPDHIWGVLDDFDDPLFVNAIHMMGRAEWDYWWNPETVNTIGAARTTFAVGARRRMEAIEGSVAMFDDGQEILPGIAAVASHGHTPGHMSFEIRNGSEAAMVLGDAIGNHHVAFRKPGWHSGSDQDAEMAAETRRSLFDRLTAERMRLVGFHLPGGGIGRADHFDDGFIFLPGDA
ncbi:glyoxylase-like metal-dependent hydrolase (beta-lactamase superfamily II) [Aliiruegeria haliotis]|uniref:Glyoxylase-like metal-dependent hydrolase (Beta-lactamase superfamily II) n=1 Tax=Aliiruegeria haliotis TaxID=1280846 RepID=A0A2T0RYU2_9RHOB|nr:MBL fold metallo-hydrolase [Aliiruegeria haliotis]PRY26351.1 glyoxylase-like metal-dependent hydrolase (beta-lactamase superfamily II) [Aliiruegeria haliotis]